MDTGERTSFKLRIIASAAMLTLLSAIGAASPAQAQDKPNILVIWGDDIGVHNISAYNHGIMGYQTPNIDRIAEEGALFTDAYGEQSCTAGRAAFMPGQHPFRTGLLTIACRGRRTASPIGRRPSPT
jgi:arylsulfatase